MTEDNTLEVMGYTINPKNVTNPALRRVMRNRISEDFAFKSLFGYDDHSDHKERYRRSHEQYADHTDKHHSDHSEYLAQSAGSDYAADTGDVHSDSWR